MKEEKPLVTLISIGQARIGRVFIHKGSGSKCEWCKYSRVCVKNLEPGRVYRIVKVRDKTLPCDLYETEMQVVEVVNSEISAAVFSKQAIEKAIVTFHVRDCQEENCESYEFCFPTGLMNGDRCEILAVTENLRCSQGLPLRKVLLRRVQVS